jgi:hypothetical protein
MSCMTKVGAEGTETELGGERLLVAGSVTDEIAAGALAAGVSKVRLIDGPMPKNEAESSCWEGGACLRPGLARGRDLLGPFAVADVDSTLSPALETWKEPN